MFESYFGFTAPPFQLSPDPQFYFPSQGHGHAMAYLKFGVYQGEGFIVVTGEVGAGKTTLIASLLGSLDPKRIVSAHLVNTQLDSGELLQSIGLAFGVDVPDGSKARMLAALEAFFTAVAAGGRRALLVVDEAQNLGLPQVEELRMLSNIQLGSRSLLQSFLVGQPELRAMLRSRSMEQLRQRVIASCHLGPLDEQETRRYIEYRLRRVGWKDAPRIEPGAYAAIYRHSAGIPRRINQLCSRLLLAAFLESRSAIGLHDVAAVVEELGAENGPSRLALASVPTQAGT